MPYKSKLALRTYNKTYYQMSKRKKEEMNDSIINEIVLYQMMNPLASINTTKVSGDLFPITKNILDSSNVVQLAKLLKEFSPATTTSAGAMPRAQASGPTLTSDQINMMVDNAPIQDVYKRCKTLLTNRNWLELKRYVEEQREQLAEIEFQLKQQNAVVEIITAFCSLNEDAEDHRTSACQIAYSMVLHKLNSNNRPLTRSNSTRSQDEQNFANNLADLNLQTPLAPSPAHEHDEH